METIEKVKTGLIAKILGINNKNILEEIDKLISSDTCENDIIELTEEQKLMLEMSEIDIQNGKVISQDDMEKRNLIWLKSM